MNLASQLRLGIVVMCKARFRRVVRCYSLSLYESCFDQGCLRRLPVVEPDHGHTKLRLAKQGLEAIQKIETPIAAVSVCTEHLLSGFSPHLKCGFRVYSS
jgi:hypothetical protein